MRNFISRYFRKRRLLKYLRKRKWQRIKRTLRRQKAHRMKELKSSISLYFEKRRRVKSLRREKRRSKSRDLKKQKLLRKQVRQKKIQKRQQWRRIVRRKIERAFGVNKRKKKPVGPVRKWSFRIIIALFILATTLPFVATRLLNLSPGMEDLVLTFPAAAITAFVVVCGIILRKQVYSFSKGHPWAIGAIILIATIIWFFMSEPSPNRAMAKAPIPLSQQRWEYTWTIVQGMSKSGYKTMTHKVTINELSPNLIDFTLHYYQGSKKEETHFRWDKSASEVGTWMQSNPFSEGTFVLNKRDEGIYTGTAYGRNNEGYECTMIIELRRVP